MVSVPIKQRRMRPRTSRKQHCRRPMLVLQRSGNLSEAENDPKLNSFPIALIIICCDDAYLEPYQMLRPQLRSRRLPLPHSLTKNKNRKLPFVIFKYHLKIFRSSFDMLFTGVTNSGCNGSGKRLAYDSQQKYTINQPHFLCKFTEIFLGIMQLFFD